MSISIPRSLALAGAAALAASMALTGAQGAVAAATTGSTPAAAPQADKATARSLDLALDGVPRTFVAGGETRLFNFTVDNNTKSDFVYYPLLKFKNARGSLHAQHLKVEYQLPESLDKSKTWLPAAPAPGGGESDDDGVLFLLAKLIDDSVPDYANALLAVNKGSSVTVTVRVSVGKDAPLGSAGVVPVVFAAKAEGNQPVGEGEFSCDGIRGESFKIVAGGGGKPSPSATPSTSKPTGPTAGPTGKPTGSPSGSTTPTAPTTSGSPSGTKPPTGSPSAPVTPSTGTSPSASTTPTGTGSPSASTTPTATGSPSATTTPTGSTSPTAPGSASPSASATTAPATTAPAAPAPTGTPGDDDGGVRQPIDFPVKLPVVAPLPITPAGVAQARSKADKALASTGGGDDTTGIAIAGGAVLAVGVGTVVVLRRRRSAQQG
ncbi:LPXTG cell wall anchor domain-containing protein [Kitasatospora misakiensis]|uniref:LPXTG cell wall anchor domain-containing protein n=1 Tax=Kitasatospora misakiensis TaxID=67330 RepID=A0ABW0X8N8_9ACTN